MKQLIDFIPLILFFLGYKFYNVQVAAIVLVVATVIQLIALKVIYKKIEKAQLITAIAVVFFGSLTAYFNELSFLKLKVNIVYAIFALTLFIAQFGFKKLLIKELLGKEISLPEQVWKRINLGWTAFFVFCLFVNIYVSNNFSEDFWVQFKVFGFLGLTLLATIISGVYIYKHIIPDNSQDKI